MSTRSILLLGSLAVVAACTARDDAARTDSTAATPNVVSLSASEYEFRAPDSIAGGWTTFRMANHGKEIHYGHIVRLDPGKTVPELVDAYAEAIRTSGPRPAWVKRFGGPGGAIPGDSSSVTQYLEPGRYVWICAVEDEKGIPHFSKGEHKPFVVGPATGRAADRNAAPAAGMVIRLADFSFALDVPVRAGHHTIRVENVGKEPHDLVLWKLAPGKTAQDLGTVLNPEQARRPDQAGDAPQPLETLGSVEGGIAAIAPGMEVFFETNLTPGEYALTCMTTAPDGRSHIEHGMIRQVTVK